MNQVSLNKNDYYSTSDLAMVTAITLFFPIEAIDRTQDTRKAYFWFRKSRELDQLIEAYFRGELKVSPALYFQQLKIIKARLYSEGGDIHS